MKKAQWRSRTSSRNFDDFIPAGHKVFSEGCESRHNHRYAFVVQDLDTQWIQAYPCKMKKSPRGPRPSTCLSPSSWSRQRNQKSFTPTITWNLANPVNNYLGIIVRLHLIVLRQMALLKERYAGSKKEHMQYFCKPIWMKTGGMIPWSVLLPSAKHSRPLA